MPRSLPPTGPSRQRRFEEFENRIVMTAQALTAIAPDLSVDPQLVTSVNTSSDQAIVTSSQDFVSPTTEAAQLAAQYGLDGSGQTVVVIDTGIAFDHAALGGGFGEGFRVVGGYDFAEMDDNPYDDGPTGFHGTNVAGIIGSSDSRYQGVASGADLVALRVFDDSGATQLQWIEQSLQWVIDNVDTFENPITTVNLSLGTTPDEVFLEILNDELQQLEEAGIFISVAAGNFFEQGASGLAYPASSPFVVPVASHGATGEISDFSQRASNVLVAPGEGIVSTVPEHLFFGTREDPFLGVSGTSQAAPYVAGVSALLRQAYHQVGIEDVNQDLIYDQLFDTADSIYDAETDSNYARINLEAALEAVFALESTDSNAPDSNAPDSTPMENAATESAATESASPEAELPAAAPSAPASESVESPTVEIPAAEPEMEAVAPTSVELIGRVVEVTGSDGIDSLAITTTDQEIQITVNENLHSFLLDDVDQVNFAGGGGQDSLLVDLLGNSNDNISVNQNEISITNANLTITGVEIASSEIRHGGGTDNLTIAGSDQDDAVAISHNSVTLANADFSFSAGKFRTVSVDAAAGDDQIEFVGSRGNDRLIQQQSGSYFRSQQLESIVTGFESLTVDGNGGQDQATLAGTSAAEQIVLNQDNGQISGGELEVDISDFDQINVNATHGDDVQLIGSEGNDRLFTRGSAAQLTGAKFEHTVRNFENLSVDSNGGQDAAFLSASGRGDHFEHAQDVSRLVSRNNEITINDFALVAARSRGGADTAAFVGSDADETIDVNERNSRITHSDGSTGLANGFSQTTIDAGGGEDAVNLLGSRRDEELTISGTRVDFSTTRQDVRIENVERSNFSGGGGHDRVEINNVGPLDLLTTLGDGVNAQLRNHTAHFDDIDEIEANAVDNAIAFYDLEAVDIEYNLNGRWFDFSRFRR